MAATLRGLFKFGALRGLVDTGLAEAVPSVFSYRLSSVPVGISDASIDRVLDFLKSDSATSCRDRAILVLLATYGVRTGQIAELRLGSLAWREKRITFCAQKRSKSIVHALTPAVAETIARYLREHRPQVEHDYVFVLRHRPFSPVSDSVIRSLVAHRLREAGINSGPVAPRAFRYALASRLLDARQPFKLIADTFGHQSLRATAVYTKLNRPYLEEAAAEWQEIGI